MKFQVEN